MKKINFSQINQHAKRLINDTNENSYKDSGLYRCEKYDGHIYIAALDKNGRAMDFVEVVKYG